MKNKTYHYKINLKDNTNYSFDNSEDKPSDVLKAITSTKFYVFDGICINTDYIKHIEYSEV